MRPYTLYDELMCMKRRIMGWILSSCFCIFLGYFLSHEQPNGNFVDSANIVENWLFESLNLNALKQSKTNKWAKERKEKGVELSKYTVFTRLKELINGLWWDEHQVNGEYIKSGFLLFKIRGEKERKVSAINYYWLEMCLPVMRLVCWVFRAFLFQLRGM